MENLIRFFMKLLRGSQGPFVVDSVPLEVHKQTPKSIIDICEKYWEVHKSNCSGFVKAVAGELKVDLTGQANDVVDQIQNSPWRTLKNGVEANAKAAEGKLVVGGTKGDEHGHVVIIVPQESGKELNRGKYPFAYWGQLGAVGRKNETINWAWPKDELDQVIYSYCEV